MKIQYPLVSLLIISAVPVWAEPESSASPANSVSATTSAQTSPAATRAPSKLLYKPPADGGKMPTRVSGGARGGGDDTSLLALVPDHAALTTNSQPSLFWFQSKAAKSRLELTLVEPKKAKPLLSLTNSQPTKAGIHRVKLALQKIELQPNVLYEWTVAIVPDAENRSKDVIAKGVIKRISPPGDLAGKLENKDDVGKAAVYAESGIWYDALESISNAIDAQPGDASLRAQRSALLQQVGLPEAAAVDKK